MSTALGFLVAVAVVVVVVIVVIVLGGFVVTAFSLLVIVNGFSALFLIITSKFIILTLSHSLSLSSYPDTLLFLSLVY